MGLQISPAVMTGAQHSQAVFRYKNVGTTTEHLTVQAVELKPVTVHGKHGWAPYGEFDHATVTPERSTLKPGQAERITLRVNSTDGHPHHIAVMVTAQGGSHATGRISASVAARMDVKGTPPPTASPLPILPIGIALAVLVALMAVWAVLLKRRHRRRRPAQPTEPYGMIP